MGGATGTVWVVEANETVGRSLVALARSMGLNCEVYASAETWLAALAAGGDEPCPACILFDLGMCTTPIEEFQSRLDSQGVLAPLVVTTDATDVGGAVAAMRRGAFTVVGRPCPVGQIESAIRDALAWDARSRAERKRRLELKRRFDALDPRQRHALAMIVEGRPNKLIARHLGVSKRTVDRIRAELFAALGVESAVEAVRLAVVGGWIGDISPAAESAHGAGASDAPDAARPLQPSAETAHILHAPQPRRQPHFRRAREDRSPTLGAERFGAS